ncbi:MAG: hypothetical protein KC469_05410 [Flavobacteriaceae bacterium]|nr:hypothetical protein [Flavobacteriaceae bacterium]
MQLPSTFQDLINEAQTLELYSKLILQLNKDLALANVDLSFDIEVLPIDLKLAVHESVYGLIQDKFAEYLNLLYIIDVSEKKIKQLDGSDTLKLSEAVTFLILQREWQKVWYKNLY